MNWDLYVARMNINGTTRRERAINKTRNKILRSQGDLAANHIVFVRGEEVNMVIHRTETAYIKKFNAMGEYDIDYGDYVVWGGRTYIVTQRDYDDEVHIYGELTLCNYEMKWQTREGNIASRWCSVNIISKYNNGVFEGKAIDSLETTLSISLPFDDETKFLRRNRRLVMDFVDDDPYVYTISQRDVLTQHFGDAGLIILALTQSTGNAATDDPDSMVSEYDPHLVLNGIVGAQIIRIGQANAYTTSNQVPVWNVTLEDNPSGDINAVVEIIKNDGANIVIRALSNSANINKLININDGTDNLIVTVKGIY